MISHHKHFAVENPGRSFMWQTRPFGGVMYDMSVAAFEVFQHMPCFPAEKPGSSDSSASRTDTGVHWDFSSRSSARRIQLTSHLRGIKEEDSPRGGNRFPFQ